MKKQVFFISLFSLFLPLVSSQILKMEVKAVNEPGIFGYASAFRQFEKRFPTGKLNQTFLWGETTSNGAYASSSIKIVYNPKYPTMGFKIYHNAITKRGIASKATAGTVSKKGVKGPAEFSVSYNSIVDFKAKIEVRLHIDNKDKNALVKGKFGNWSKTVNTKGQFDFKTYIPVHFTPNKQIKFNFSLYGYSSSDSIFIGAGYNMYLEFKLISSLEFSTFGKSCKGRIGVKNPPQFGRHLTVTLNNGNKRAFTFLLAGNSDKKFNGFKLPLELSQFGAPGCILYTNIVITFVTFSDHSGYARKTFFIPLSWQIPGFPPVYFQWAQLSKSNSLGLVFSNAGKLSTK